MPDAFMVIHQGTLISSTAVTLCRSLGPTCLATKEGGLLSYGANFPNICRRAAPYADLILRGAKPAELPVQVPTRVNE